MSEKPPEKLHRWLAKRRSLPANLGEIGVRRSPCQTFRGPNRGRYSCIPSKGVKPFLIGSVSVCGRGRLHVDGGFDAKHRCQQEDCTAMLVVAEMLPKSSLNEHEQLPMIYDTAVTRPGDENDMNRR